MVDLYHFKAYPYMRGVKVPYSHVPNFNFGYDTEKGGGKTFNY